MWGLRMSLGGAFRPSSAAAAGGNPPVNSVAPVISGNVQVGQTLTTTDGTWTGDATISFTYQWKRVGVDIGSATNNTYVLVVADAGKAITCVVTGTNSAGSASATSNSLTINITVENAGIAVQITNGATSTFSAASIGTAGTGRELIFLVAGHATGGSPGLSGFTVDGNAATQVGSSVLTADYAAGVFKYQLDAGTTANLVASWNGVTVGRAAVAVFALQGANATETDTAGTSTTGALSLTATIDVPTNGAAIAFCIHSNTNAAAWSGTGTVEATAATTVEATLSCGSATNVTAGVNQSLTATWSGSAPGAIVAGAWGP